MVPAGTRFPNQMRGAALCLPGPPASCGIAQPAQFTLPLHKVISHHEQQSRGLPRGPCAGDPTDGRSRLPRSGEMKATGRWPQSYGGPSGEVPDHADRSGGVAFRQDEGDLPEGKSPGSPGRGSAVAGCSRPSRSQSVST